MKISDFPAYAIFLSSYDDLLAVINTGRLKRADLFAGINDNFPWYLKVEDGLVVGLTRTYDGRYKLPADDWCRQVSLPPAPWQPPEETPAHDCIVLLLCQLPHISSSVRRLGYYDQLEKEWVLVGDSSDFTVLMWAELPPIPNDYFFGGDE